jgi:hypothetical protein
VGRGHKFVLIFEDDVSDDEIMVIIPYKAIYDPSFWARSKNSIFTTPHLWVKLKIEIYDPSSLGKI